MSKYFHTNISRTVKILSPKELQEQLPVTLQQRDFILKTQESIRNIIDGKDKRLMLVVGPCSIHDPFSAKEYAFKLKSLQERFRDKWLFVMRVYFEKPRTLFGWKGFLGDPDLNGALENDMGLRRARLLLLELAELGVPAATEFLTPYTPHYLEDLISWGAIGARTACSPIHRQMASGLSMPIGFKNSTDGDLESALNGTLTATLAQSFFGIDNDGAPAIVHTTGNSHAHLVLRGSIEKSNYDLQSVLKASKELAERKLKSRLMIDCSHDNSRKVADNQSKVFLEILNQVQSNPSIFGMMLESHLQSGKQPWQKELESLQYGVSITDDCLGWQETVELIEAIHTVKI